MKIYAGIYVEWPHSNFLAKLLMHKCARAKHAKTCKPAIAAMHGLHHCVRFGN